MMFTKHVSQLTYSDIDDLINVRQEREGYSLDFKVGFGNPDKAKKELAKDISSFANASGGFLIIGVDKNYLIIGVDRLIQNKQIDEWINQILNSNIEPTTFYFDPKIISIPNSEKVIVVIHVPESTKKPHIVTESNNYYLRFNDSSKSANHSQIRDMFELSKRRNDEFNEFVVKKNLFDEDDINFGKNKNSNQLFSQIPSKLGIEKPLLIFSLFVKDPSIEKINIPFTNFHAWLRKKSEGYQPCPSHSIFYGNYEYDLRLDGVVLKNMRSKDLSSYFEVLNNGYVEAGFSNSFFNAFPENWNNTMQAGVYLTPIVIYEMMFLGFAKEFYALAKYYDEVMLQLSFVNTLNFTSWGLNAKYSNGWHGKPPTNKQHNNFKITYRFNPTTLTYDGILQIAKHHSEKICRAFGLPQDYCFVDNQLSLAEMNNFYL